MLVHKLYVLYNQKLFIEYVICVFIYVTDFCNLLQAVSENKSITKQNPTKKNLCKEQILSI